MTDNKIIKAFEYCFDKNSGILTVVENGEQNIITVGDVCEVFTRQKAEIKRLTTLAKLGNMRANDYREMRNKLKKANAEIERLQKAIEVVDIMEEQHKRYVEKVKAEAIKEVFDKVDSMCIDTFGNFNHKAFISIKKETAGDV